MYTYLPYAVVNEEQGLFLWDVLAWRMYIGNVNFMKDAQVIDDPSRLRPRARGWKHVLSPGRQRQQAFPCGYQQSLAAGGIRRHYPGSVRQPIRCRLRKNQSFAHRRKHPVPRWPCRVQKIHFVLLRHDRLPAVRIRRTALIPPTTSNSSARTFTTTCRCSTCHRGAATGRPKPRSSRGTGIIPTTQCMMASRGSTPPRQSNSL